MLRNVLTGLAAGAVGTAMLNVTTYADMAIRGRPASNVPASIVEKVASTAEIELAGSEDQKTAENRKSALGALNGYMVGLGIGAAYGLLRSPSDQDSTLASGVGLGLAAMAASDVPATALGVTDPRTWSAASWLSDITPHLVYGVATATAYRAFNAHHQKPTGFLQSR